MRQLLPGFDAFQDNGWQPFLNGGLDEVNNNEAPLFMFAADLADPDLAARLANDYEQEGLLTSDLRFGAWPDFKPTTPRGKSELPGVHINTFGSRQARFPDASEPEQRALQTVTIGVERLVREVIDPAYGVFVARAGKVPTIHEHVVAREQQPDGLAWDMGQRAVVSLGARQEARARLLEVEVNPADWVAETEKHILRALGNCIIRS